MAKNNINEYDSTASNNEDVAGISVLGSALPSTIDNAQRAIMSHIADAVQGNVPVLDTWSWRDTADATKIGRFDMGGIATSTTRVYTMPDANGTVVLADATQTLSNKTYADPTFTGTLTIPDNAIALADIAQIADMKLLGNVSGGTGNVAAVSILDEDDMASDSATAVPTQQSVKAHVAAARLQSFVESTPVAMSTSDQFTLTHGFGSTPKLVRYALVCNSTDGGYAVGDEVTDIYYESNNSDSNSITLWANSTTVGISFNQPVQMTSKAGGTSFNPDDTKWNVVLRAWK